SGYIELPENPSYRNDSLKTLEVLIKEFGSLNRYFDKTPINCRVKQNRSVFISATGLVYPCCWVYHQANCRTLYNVRDPFELGVENILRDIGGVHRISAKECSLKDIVEGDFFSRIEESWDAPGLARGRLKVCASACGCRMDMYEKQFENKALIPGISHTENSESDSPRS
ncbi:unnamed protein product, partial [marine sediment metagenome]